MVKIFYWNREKRKFLPWPVWLSVLCIVSQSERLLVHFQSGHTPGLRFRSWLGCVWEGANQCFSLTLMLLSLSFFLPSPLSKNKCIKDLKKKRKPLWAHPSSSTPNYMRCFLRSWNLLSLKKQISFVFCLLADIQRLPKLFQKKTIKGK